LANIITLDADIPSKKRYKVTYELRDISGDRKRKSKTFPSGTSLKEVQAFKRKMEQEYEDSEPTDYSKRTLESFIGEYFELYSDSLSPSTTDGYRRLAYTQEHGIITHLGHYELSQITTRTLQEYVRYLNSEGLSAKTVKNYVSFLHTLYDKALKLHYVTKGYNIVSDVELPRNRKKKVQSYSIDEIRKLLRIIDRDGNDEFKLEVYIAVLTGCRRSEMSAMTIDSINLDNKIWHIDKSKVRAGSGEDALKEPKTDAGVRDVPLCRTLCIQLRKAIRKYNQKKLQAGADFEDSGFLFSNKYGHPYRTNVLTARWNRFMREHEDEIRYLPLHCAGRHSYASIAIEQGLDIKALQEILGHSDSSTTLNTYANSYLKTKKNYAKDLDSVIFQKKQA